MNRGKTISKFTVASILDAHKLHKYLGTYGQALTDIQKAVRLAWCIERKDWVDQDWNKVMFTDESMFRETGRSRQWLIRFSNKKYKILSII